MSRPIHPKSPGGCDAVIGENETYLSGGEKQRIAITRVLLKNAPIILLDEAMAALDPENELLIQEAINELIQDKTVVVIAHRLHSIQHADKIIVLENGAVSGTGAHDELLQQNSLYAKMWNEQQTAGRWRLAAKI